MDKVRNWILARLGVEHAGEPVLDEVEALTRQFHVTLRAHITKIEEAVKADEAAGKPVPEALLRIRAIVGNGNDKLCWQDAYNIEQQLVHLYDTPTLRIELDRRLLDAENALAPEVTAWYRKTTEGLTERADLAALLSRLINDLQWRYTIDEAKRGYTKEVTGRTKRIYALAFSLFALALAYAIDVFGFHNELSVDDVSLLPFVALAGAFGAAFSMMTSLKHRLSESSLDDLKLNRSWGLIVARILVGIGAGFVLFFFMRSGLLGGEAFPKLASDEETATPLSLHLVHRQEFAKLFIWCFLAGFSEKLIPNLLAKTEGKNSDSAVGHPSPAGQQPLPPSPSPQQAEAEAVPAPEPEPEPVPGEPEAEPQQAPTTGTATESARHAAAYKGNTPLPRKPPAA